MADPVLPLLPPPPPAAEALRRRNVTRACDACKRRKVKCDGQHPCARCTNTDINCTYNASYNRVQGRPLGHPVPRKRARQPSSGPDNSGRPTPASSSHMTEEVRTEDGSGMMEIEDDLGDASVHAFLQRVSGHLGQIGQGLPRNLFKKHEESTSNNTPSTVNTLILPDRQTAVRYFEAYFDHGNATCRFLPRDGVLADLDRLYNNDSEITEDCTRMAIILLVISTGCVWSASFSSAELSPFRAKALPILHAAESRLDKVERAFPPTLEVVQAQVLKCQCELVLGRFNSAWMTLGCGVRLAQMIDIQREPPPSMDKLEAFYRQRLFWAIFMIDRYLAVILGRPMAIHERDITVKMSSQIDDAIGAQIDNRERKLLTGTAAHYGLVLIISKAASQLYPAANLTPARTETIVSELETQIQQWLEATPSFFHPKSDSRASKEEEQFFDVPWILKRQQRTVQAAYFFTHMLIYRGFLLQDFLHQEIYKPRHNNPSSERVRKCVDNAIAMIELSAKFGVSSFQYNGTFWITSHFVFCSISILVVYLTLCQNSRERAMIEKTVAEGMRFHRKLDNRPNISAQKLLDESRTRAEVVQKIRTPTSSLADPVSESEPHTMPAVSVMDGDDTAVLLGSPGKPLPEHPSQPSQPQHVEAGSESLRPPEILDLPALGSLNSPHGFDTIMDFGFEYWVDPGTLAEVRPFTE